MTAGLEVRRGRAVPTTSELHVWGSNGNVSSSTVTTFDLEGQVTRFAGGSVPFQAGDEAIVSGFRSGSGVFVALAVRLPRQGLLLGGSSPWHWLFGALFFAVGCGALLSLPVVIWNGREFDDLTFRLIGLFLPMALGCAFTWAGYSVMRDSERSSLARHLLATDPTV